MSEYRVNNVMVPLFLLETVATGCLAVIFYYLKYLDNFKERRYPMPCADIQWISYPYYEDTDGRTLYLSDPALYSACFFIPTVTVILFEIINWFFYLGDKKPILAACPNWTFHFFTRRVIRILGTLLFGIFLTMVFTFTLKYMFAVPRPHFLEVCRPNATVFAIECGGDIYTDRLPADAMFTPSAATCQAGAHEVDAALRSFPSEHAALAAFSATFLAAYLHRMTSFRRLVTARPLLVALTLLGGVTPAIGSLHAFYARWADLLAGYVLGAGIAVYLTQVTLWGFAEVRQRRGPSQTVASLPAAPSSRPALSLGTQEELIHSAGLDGDGPPTIPRAHSGPPGKLNEIANRAAFTEPSVGYVNRAYNGQHLPARRPGF